MKIGSHFILFPYSQNLNPVLISRGEGSTGPWTSRSRADRGYISRLGKRSLGDSSTYDINNRDYLGPEEKVPWIRLIKELENAQVEFQVEGAPGGGDDVPWLRLKKAGRVPTEFLEDMFGMSNPWEGVFGGNVWYV